MNKTNTGTKHGGKKKKKPIQISVFIILLRLARTPDGEIK